MQRHGRQPGLLSLFLVDLAAFQLIAEDKQTILQLLDLASVGSVLCAQRFDGNSELLGLALAGLTLGTRGPQGNDGDDARKYKDDREAHGASGCDHRAHRQESAKTERTSRRLVLNVSLRLWRAAGPVRFVARRLNTSSICLLYTSPSPRDGLLSRMPS